MTSFEDEGSLASEVNSGSGQAPVERNLDTQALGAILKNGGVSIGPEIIEELGIGE